MAPGYLFFFFLFDGVWILSLRTSGRDCRVGGSHAFCECPFGLTVMGNETFKGSADRQSHSNALVECN